MVSSQPSRSGGAGAPAKKRPAASSNDIAIRRIGLPPLSVDSLLRRSIGRTMPCASSDPGWNSDPRLRLRVGLAQRVLGRERLDRHAVGVDASCNRIVGGIAPARQLRTGQMRGETDVRNGRLIADAELSAAWIARQHLFDGAAAFIEPVAHPRGAR